MTTLLIFLTVLEVLVLVGVLAVYLVAITRTLRRTSKSLAKVSFGVRAIETQCAPIGPSVTKINGQLETIAGALAGVAGLANAAAPPPAGASPHGPTDG
jgi:ABC-type branched-subunit amino acid transport system permease subunit